MEYSTLLLLQLFSDALARHGAQITFDFPPQADASFLEKLGREAASREQQALAAIAEALRKDTRDFDCIDEIIHILEPLGYVTVPRHDFG